MQAPMVKYEKKIIKFFILCNRDGTHGSFECNLMKKSLGILVVKG